MPAKKYLSQNFLVDQHVLAQMHALIAPQKTDYFFEIGPGKGALTGQILPFVASLTAVERDADLLGVLRRRFAAYQGQFTLVHQDALRYSLDTIIVPESADRLRVVGNVPYHITSPLLFHCLDYATLIRDMHFMFQKEVVTRLVAQPGTSAYSRLSVMVQYFCQVKACLSVSADSFRPRPAVDSAVVLLQPYRKIPFLARNMQHFSALVRLAFQQRRKQLVNALGAMVTREDLAQANLGSGTMRPQDCSVADFVRLSNVVSLHS
jgi:16S rRNA (adenine1518-N6/adenine1519-N6)-dimethyltransferase